MMSRQSIEFSNVFAFANKAENGYICVQCERRKKKSEGFSNCGKKFTCSDCIARHARLERMSPQQWVRLYI